MKLIDLTYEEIMALEEDEFYLTVATFFEEVVADGEIEELIEDMKKVGSLDHAKELFTLAIYETDAVNRDFTLKI